MRRGKTDKAGRPIRFSFCKIYQTNEQDDRERAYNAFVKIITDWDYVEEAIREERQPPLIKVIPAARTSGNALPGSNIEYAIKFDELSFMDLLENGTSKLDCIDFEYRSDGKFSTDEFTKSFIWPRNGFILKWTKFDGYVECMSCRDRTSVDFNDFNNNKNANNDNYLVRGINKFKNAITNPIKNPQPQKTMEQNDILTEIKRLYHEIDKLYQNYEGKMDKDIQFAIKMARECLSFALTEK